jgi:uncharacterized repeat protein (TIGR01451 family)
MQWIAKLAWVIALGLPGGAETPSVPQARLDVCMEGPHLKYVGPTNAYTINIDNPGDAPAKNVVVCCRVPCTFKIISSLDGGKVDPANQTITWKWDELPPGKTRSVQMRLKSVHAYSGRIISSVTADGGLQADVSLGGNEEGPGALLLEVVDINDPVRVGGKAIYQVLVSNNCGSSFHGVELSVNVPFGMKAHHIDAPVGHDYFEGCRFVRFKCIDSLRPGKSALFRIECDVEETDGEPVRFEASVDAAEHPDQIIETETTRVLSAK